jgi:hypothetical protein
LGWLLAKGIRYEIVGLPADIVATWSSPGSAIQIVPSALAAIPVGRAPGSSDLSWRTPAGRSMRPTLSVPSSVIQREPSGARAIARGLLPGTGSGASTICPVGLTWPVLSPFGSVK